VDVQERERHNIDFDEDFGVNRAFRLYEEEVILQQLNVL
jgi:hypothetical protein